MKGLQSPGHHWPAVPAPPHPLAHLPGLRVLRLPLLCTFFLPSAISCHLGSPFSIKDPSSFLKPLRPHPCLILDLDTGKESLGQAPFSNSWPDVLLSMSAVMTKLVSQVPPRNPNGSSELHCTRLGGGVLPPIAPGRKGWPAPLPAPHSQAPEKPCPRSEPCRAYFHGVVLPTPHQSKSEEVLEPRGGERTHLQCTCVR